MFGLPEIARCYRQLDPARAAVLYQRWLAAAEEADDAEGMLEAALNLAQLDLLTGVPCCGEWLR